MSRPCDGGRGACAGTLNRRPALCRIAYAPVDRPGRTMTLRLLIAALVFGFATHPAAGQIELDAGGNASVGNAAPLAGKTLFVNGGTSNNMSVYAFTNGTGGSRYGVLTEAEGGTYTYGIWARGRYASNGYYGLYATGSGVGAPPSAFVPMAETRASRMGFTHRSIITPLRRRPAILAGMSWLPVRVAAPAPTRN